ncbi:O-antigen polymerase [Peribacillus frigoritolerans]|uniref:O-antigen polymerase n=1 Tax=Peribacillus frigoritolerans TaxID=450367 RepID=UPI003D086431
MVFNSIFSYMSFAIYVVIFLLVYGYVKRIITYKGFNGLSMFILSFSMFYFVVPFIQTFFKLYRDDTSLFTRLLNQISDEEIFLNLFISSICLLLIVFSYKLNFKSKGSEPIQDSINQNVVGKDVLYKKINRITDMVFLVGLGSMIFLIAEVGSLKTYLSLGAMTRGLDKSPTDFIRSSYLQLVTLSVIILVTPYLYLYLYRMKKSKFIIIKFLVSFLFSVLFLFYNQGRAPLIIFFLPFLFTISKRSKKNFLGLVGMFVVGLFLLNYLDAIFQYFAYGNYLVEKNGNFITGFLSEFSYPFTNFSLRNDLIDINGYRYMYDYLIWPLTMIPSSLLNIVGLSKESLISVSTLNTEAYGVLLGVTPTGGIPVDLLTYNYYQFGFVTLIPMCFVIGRILRKLDKIFVFFDNNFAIKIVLYRISFSLITFLNNADISAIVRNRLDVVLLALIIIYIYKKSLKVSLKQKL